MTAGCFVSTPAHRRSRTTASILRPAVPCPTKTNEVGSGGRTSPARRLCGCERIRRNEQGGAEIGGGRLSEQGGSFPNPNPIRTPTANAKDAGPKGRGPGDWVWCGSPGCLSGGGTSRNSPLVAASVLSAPTFQGVENSPLTARRPRRVDGRKFWAEGGENRPPGGWCCMDDFHRGLDLRPTFRPRCGHRRRGRAAAAPESRAERRAREGPDGAGRPLPAVAGASLYARGPPTPPSTGALQGAAPGDGCLHDQAHPDGVRGTPRGSASLGLAFANRQRPHPASLIRLARRTPGHTSSWRQPSAPRARENRDAVGVWEEVEDPPNRSRAITATLAAGALIRSLRSRRRKWRSGDPGHPRPPRPDRRREGRRGSS